MIWRDLIRFAFALTILSVFDLLAFKLLGWPLDKHGESFIMACTYMILMAVREDD